MCYMGVLCGAEKDNDSIEFKVKSKGHPSVVDPVAAARMKLGAVVFRVEISASSFSIELVQIA